MFLLKITGIIILLIAVIILFFLFFPAVIEIKAEKTFLKADIKFYIGIIKIKFEISGDNTDIGWYLFGKRMEESDEKEPPPKKERKNLSGKPSKATEKNKHSDRKKVYKRRKKKSKLYKFIKKPYIVLESVFQNNAFKKSAEVIKSIFEFPKYKKFDVYIKFGFENPADTGMVYGLMCAVFSGLRFKPKTEPNFENEVFDFSADIKGGFNVCKLAVFMIKLLSDKELSEIIRKWFRG